MLFSYADLKIYNGRLLIVRLSNGLLVPVVAGLILSVTACGLTDGEKQLIKERGKGLYGTSGRWDSLEDYALRESLPRIDGDADLSDYLSFGLQNHFGLRGAYDRWLEAMYGIPMARSYPDPKINFNYLLIPIETRTGAQIAQLGLSQIFPWFGKTKLRGEIAAKKAERLWWKVQETRLGVIRDIKVVFYEYALLKKEIEISGENLKLLKEVEPIVQRRIQTGADQSELLRLQIEIGKNEVALKTLNSSRRILSTRLKSLLNCKNEGILPWPRFDDFEVSKLKKADLYGVMIGSNPELKGLIEKINLNAKASELSEKNRYPDVGIGVNRFETQGSSQGGSDSGRDPLALMFSFALPIDQRKYDAAEKQARAGLRAAHADMGQRWNELDAILEQLIVKHNIAIDQILLYEQSLLPRAKQNWRVSLTGYMAGKISVLDLIESERAMLNFENALWRQRAEYQIQRAGLEAICGGKIK